MSTNKGNAIFGRCEDVCLTTLRGGAVTRNMWEQLAGHTAGLNIGRVHFSGACQLPVNVKLMSPLPCPLRMPCGFKSSDTRYKILLLATSGGRKLEQRLRGLLVMLAGRIVHFHPFHIKSFEK